MLKETGYFSNSGHIPDVSIATGKAALQYKGVMVKQEESRQGAVIQWASNKLHAWVLECHRRGLQVSYVVAMGGAH